MSMPARLLAAFALCLATEALAVLEPGAPAPVPLGLAADGSVVRIGQSRGMVTVVTFWATWCAPCRRELPLLEGLQRAAWGRVQVIAVNIDERERFRAMARELSSLALKVTHDVDNRVRQAYGVKGIPHTVIIGRDGRVTAVLMGYNDDSIDEILEEVNEDLAAN